MNYEVKYPTQSDELAAQLPRVGRLLDGFFNEPGKPPVRFVLMLPDGGNCRYISNGISRAEVVRLFHDQVRQFLDQVQEAPRPTLPDTSNVTSLLNSGENAA